MSENYGKYNIICELARGGMGIVYKAEDPQLKRMVAIKQLFIDEVDPERKDEFRERFRREAILAANLKHPNVVSIYDVAISDESAYYIMELLKGVTLRALQDKRPGHKMSVEDYLPIFAQVCNGLSHAHDMQLVHRDIKPDNIFIEPDGTVKITDFGIARSRDAEHSSKLTKPGELLGTLSYVSPEQLQDAHNVDQRADVYSLAVVTYETLTGALPIDERSMNAMMLAIISKEAKPVNEINPEISPDVAAVIAKAMRKNADDRYNSVDDFKREFDRAINIHRGSSKGVMLRSGLGAGGIRTTGSFPGIPMLPPGSTASTEGSTSGQYGAVQGPDDPAKPVIKPWLSGRTAERAKVSGNQFNALTNSIPLVKVTGKIGVQGDCLGAFVEPIAACYRNGKIVVADAGTRSFQIFSTDGRSQGESRATQASKMGSKTGGGFSKPSGICIDLLGRIYVSDSTDHFVRIFDPQGSFLREFHYKQGQEGGISGLLYDELEGNLYLTDTYNGCVQVVTTDVGTWVRKISSRGLGEGQIITPVSLAMNGFGNLYVLDQGTCRVSVFNNAGVYQRSWGGKGKGRSEFATPRGIAIDSFDRVYVADSLNHRVQVFSANGDYLYSFGGWGNELGKFSTPTDLSIDLERNTIYVVDKGNCRVQIFEILSA